MATLNQNYTLAIESGVMGGSLAISAGGAVVDRWSGAGGSSRAEDLLVAIDDVCSRSIGGAKNLRNIAVSIGPGSFTGLRIGISTAMGLAKGIGVACVGVPILDALASSVSYNDSIISAIPMGKSDVCYQRFDRKGDQRTEIHSVPLVDFEKTLHEFAEVPIVVPDSLKDLRTHLIHNAGICLAEHIAAYVVSCDFDHGLNPIYVQNPRLR